MLFHFVFAIRRSGNNGEGGAGGGGGGTPGPSNSPKEFKTGEEVMASWKNIKYPAKILRWKEVNMQNYNFVMLSIFKVWLSSRKQYSPFMNIFFKLTCWTSSRFSPSLLTFFSRFEPDGSYMVEYYDGVKKKIRPNGLRRISVEDQPFIKVLIGWKFELLL